MTEWTPAETLLCTLLVLFIIAWWVDAEFPND